MAPETHTRYRVQRLIRMGEWLERNRAAIITAFDAIDDAHTMMIDPPEGMTDSDLLDIAGSKQLYPLQSLQVISAQLRHDIWNVKRGTDVTLHHPFALPDKQYEVVIEAPKPKTD